MLGLTAGLSTQHGSVSSQSLDRRVLLHGKNSVKARKALLEGKEILLCCTNALAHFLQAMSQRSPGTVEEYGIKDNICVGQTKQDSVAQG